MLNWLLDDRYSDPVEVQGDAIALTAVLTFSAHGGSTEKPIAGPLFTKVYGDVGREVKAESIQQLRAAEGFQRTRLQLQQAQKERELNRSRIQELQGQRQQIELRAVAGMAAKLLEVDRELIEVQQRLQATENEIKVLEPALASARADCDRELNTILIASTNKVRAELEASRKKAQKKLVDAIGESLDEVISFKLAFSQAVTGPFTQHLAQGLIEAAATEAEGDGRTKPAESQPKAGKPGA